MSEDKIIEAMWEWEKKKEEAAAAEAARVLAKNRLAAENDRNKQKGK